MIEPDLELDSSEPKPRNWVCPFPSCFASAVCVLGPDGKGTSWKAQSQGPTFHCLSSREDTEAQKRAGTTQDPTAEEQQSLSKHRPLAPRQALHSVPVEGMKLA